MAREYHARVQAIWRDRHFFYPPDVPPGALALHGNDYLGLGLHPDLIRARVRAMVAMDPSDLMSSALLERTSHQRRFERAMAAHMESDEAILCPSGWSANVGLLQTVADESTPVYIDLLAHMSLWEGARRSGAPVYPFRHNDAEHLARRVSEHGRGIVLLDSIYSTNGSVAPLSDFACVARETGCLLIADESHSLGTHGPNGAGLAVARGLVSDVAFRTSSLSKAFAARGGIIACPAGFADYFRLAAHDSVFSSAVQGYEARAFQATLDVVRRADDLRASLARNAQQLRSGLIGLGYDVSDSQSQIVSLESGCEHRTLLLRDLLAQRGVIGAAFIAPATARQHALVRLTVTSALSLADIDHVIGVCADLRVPINLRDWPSSRRARRRARPAIGAGRGSRSQSRAVHG